MSYSHLIPLISPTSGDMEDGAIIGSVLESNFAGAFTDVRIAGDLKVYRKDVSGNSFTFEDVTTAATDDNAGDFLPFGSNAQMSAGDELYIACSCDIKELYFRIATQGNWVGTLDKRTDSV